MPENVENKRTRRLSIQAIQEGFPWLMKPLELGDAALSPTRWICFMDRVKTKISNSSTFDGIWLAHFLSKLIGFFGPLRTKMLTLIPVLALADWQIRKFIWSLLWAGTVIYRSGPKKAPIPRAEKAIHLISAPESHSDFQAKSLVVPDSVPCAEASLISGVSVAFLHLMQDVYPVIALNQPIASSDPQKRLREVYPFIYRLVRTPPVWHPELAEAATENNLLGALAVGGPFAQLLECTGPNADEFCIDLNHMSKFQVREGLCQTGCKINFISQDGKLTVSSVEIEGKAVRPGDDEWEMTERRALCSLVTHSTVWRHGMQYHVAGLAPLPVITHNMPPDHPIRRLLAVHQSQTISTNFYTHLTLRRSGFDVTGFSFPYESILEYYEAGAKAFDISRLDVRLDAARRGIPKNLDYPYLRQAVRYYDLFEKYVRAYVDHWYPDEVDLERDADANIWFESVDRYTMHGIRGYVPSLTKENLTKICTLYIYSVTLEHEQNTLWDYSVFLPTTVREDGVGQSIGEVQSVMNFELVISSATNRLMNDFCYMALDERTAQIIREFQSSLTGLQAEMENEADHYWRVYPKDLEASISA